MDDKLLDVRPDGVKREIALSRREKNHVELIHCWLEWNFLDNGYRIWLDEDGKQRYRQGKRYKIDHRTVIEPGQKYLWPLGSFVRRLDEDGKLSPPLFLHQGNQRYLIIEKWLQTPNRLVLLAVDTYSKNNLVVLKSKPQESGQFPRFTRSASLLSRSISPYLAQLRDLVSLPWDGQESLCQCFEYFPATSRLMIASVSWNDEIEPPPATSAQFIPPQSLQEWLAQAPLQTDQAMKIFHQVALAIQDLHRAGLVHRNLNPTHILVACDEGNQYRVKVVGLSVIKKTESEVGLSGPIAQWQTIPESPEHWQTIPHSPEIFGDLFYVPGTVHDLKLRDVCAVAFLFLYSLQHQDRRKKLAALLQTPDALGQELPDYFSHDLPAKLRTLLGETLVARIKDGRPFSARELAVEFANALEYAPHCITRQDQYPMPLPTDVAMQGAEVAIWYEPLQEVGGDFYDLLPLAEQKYGVLIGDTMGHGLKACLYSHLIYPVAQLFAQQEIEPPKILEKMDALLAKCRRMYHGTFSTALYGILTLRPHEYTFQYANSGHPPAIHYRQRDQRAAYLVLENSLFQGSPLGTGPRRFTPFVHSLALQPGDLLIFYSDGLIETQDPRGLAYGDLFLSEIENWARQELPVAQMVHAVGQRLREFGGKSSFDDDLTLIVMRMGRA